jgi:hypothetical protein
MNCFLLSISFCFINSSYFSFLDSKKNSHIPKKEYLSCEHFDYITWDLVEKYHTKKEQQDFSKWMMGQTSSVVNGQNAIYVWDYERWLRQDKKIDQDSKDWD